MRWPLARFIVAYAQGHKEIKPLVDQTLKATDFRRPFYSLHWAAPLPGRWRPSMSVTISKAGSMNW